MMILAMPPTVPPLFRRALRFLLPVHCATCTAPLSDDPIPLFCRNCWATIAPLAHPSCPRCDHPFVSPVATIHSPDRLCQACEEEPPAYTRAWTLYPYLPPLQDAICLLKYRRKVAVVPALARLMIDRLPPLASIDSIMPVPLHAERLREREFNQSLLLADRIARHLRVPLSYTNLIRIAAAPPQTTLTRKERLKNLRGAFALRHPERIAGKRILLIDDVFTTGTTMDECAAVLRQAGSGDVFALTLARTMDAHLVPDRILAQRAGPESGLLGG
jgi:ComF family protein